MVYTLWRLPITYYHGCEAITKFAKVPTQQMHLNNKTNTNSIFNCIYVKYNKTDFERIEDFIFKAMLGSRG